MENLVDIIPVGCLSSDTVEEGNLVDIMTYFLWVVGLEIRLTTEIRWTKIQFLAFPETR